MAIRISIVEDNAQFRQTLQRYLSTNVEFECVSAYGDPVVALRKIPQDKPDVVLMDLEMPGMSGIDCTVALRQLVPEIRVIMLTVFEQDEQVFQSLEAGAYGYLVKRTPPAKILDAIREVNAGGSPMSANIARKVVNSFRQAPIVKLSPQERQVLTHLSQGDTYPHIAQQMQISIHTVRNYIRRIYEKLQVHSRTEAVAKLRGH